MSGRRVVPRVTHKQLSDFADSLYRYLYFRLNMQGYSASTSNHFHEVMGVAIHRIQMSTYRLHSDVLDRCGYFVDRRQLCQRVCDLYPKDNYFKKLYYMSAFILEVVNWEHTSSHHVDRCMGHNLWIFIFHMNFEREFESHRGWEGLADAAREIINLPASEILPSDYQAVIATVEELLPPPRRADLDLTSAALDKLGFEGMDIHEASVDEVAQVKTSEKGEIEKVEESKEGIEGNLPEVVRSSQSSHSLEFGGNVVQPQNPCEGTSKGLTEGAVCNPRSRNPRKRRFPKSEERPKSDSDTEPGRLSPTKAKVDRK